MDFLTWNDSIKLILLILVSGVSLALALGVFVSVILVLLSFWKGLLSQQKDPKKIAEKAMKVAEEEDEQGNFDT